VGRIRYEHTYNAACCQDSESNCATFTSCKNIEEKKFSNKVCTGGSAPTKTSAAMARHEVMPTVLMILMLLWVGVVQ
jgi:hypothetical protein